MMIGSLLKEYRLKQNKSQRKFIGSIVTQSYYSKVEKNISQITADNLMGLLLYRNFLITLVKKAIIHIAKQKN